MADNKIRCYSGKSADEWLSNRKWTGFLMTVPLGEAITRRVMDSNDAMSIRTTASMLNKNGNCGRTFKVVIDFDSREVTVTATNKTE